MPDKVIDACIIGSIAAAFGCAIGNMWPAAGFIILLGGLIVVICGSIKR